MKITIVGGGFAGTNAAILLSQKGFEVTLLESRSYLGGRANSFLKNGKIFDNGQHLLLGCYKETFKLFETLGTKHLLNFYPKLELDFLNSNGKKFSLNCPKFPAPFHLLFGISGFENVSFAEKLTLLKLFFGFSTKNTDEVSIENWLKNAFQTDFTTKLFWQPIATAVMNFPLEKSSAYLWENTLKTVFSGSYKNSLFVLPKTNYQKLFSVPALNFLVRNNTKVRLKTSVQKILQNENSFEIQLVNGEKLQTELLLLAVPVWKIKPLLEPKLASNPFFENIEKLDFAGIFDLTLFFEKATFEKDFLAFTNGFLQWIFNKRRLWKLSGGDQLSLTFSYSRSLGEISNNELVEKSLSELYRLVPELRGNKLLDFLVVREPKATFQPILGQEKFRLPQKTTIKNLFLAGDWTKTGFPSTIEGAALSGKLAVEEILKTLD
ncbi:FAD-dependent oxidoreductase [bacterium]|nr:FAD-dependent oxidoreductase [bacterium]